MTYRETFDNIPAFEWLRGLNEMCPWNTKHILCLFARFGIPKSMLDVGCGDGCMVNVARKLGVEAYGLDQLVQEDWPEYFFYGNAVDYFKLKEPVEMVLCFEIAEHIHESAHGTLMDTLVDNLKPKCGARLFFSAALPGQDGTGHVATRAPEYWRRELTNRGLTYNRIDTRELGMLWSNIDSPLGYLAANLQVFEK